MIIQRLQRRYSFYLIKIDLIDTLVEGQSIGVFVVVERWLTTRLGFNKNRILVQRYSLDRREAVCNYSVFYIEKKVQIGYTNLGVVSRVED